MAKVKLAEQRGCYAELRKQHLKDYHTALLQNERTNLKTMTQQELSPAFTLTDLHRLQTEKRGVKAKLHDLGHFRKPTAGLEFI